MRTRRGPAAVYLTNPPYHRIFGKGRRRMTEARRPGEKNHGLTPAGIRAGSLEISFLQKKEGRRADLPWQGGPPFFVIRRHGRVG